MGVALGATLSRTPEVTHPCVSPPPFTLLALGVLDSQAFPSKFNTGGESEFSPVLAGRAAAVSAAALPLSIYQTETFSVQIKFQN